MHIVYKLVFEVESLPNSYIGSKSNAVIYAGKIISDRGEYKTSSKDELLLFYFSTGVRYNVTLLGEYETYKDALSAERQAHIQYDVVKSNTYFNKSIACENNFTNPDYATYTNGVKTVRLLRNDQSVINGDFWGVSKNKKSSSESILKSKRFGDKNHFYGKTHSENAKISIGNKNSVKMKSMWDEMSEDDKLIRTQHLSQSGAWERSEEYKQTLSGMCNLKSPTGEIERFYKGEIEYYKSIGWVPQNLGKKLKTIECPHCNKHGTKPNMLRWHFDNCKQRKLNENFEY